MERWYINLSVVIMSNTVLNLDGLSLISGDGRRNCGLFLQNHPGASCREQIRQSMFNDPNGRFKGTLMLKTTLGILLSIAVLPFCDSLIFARGGDGFAQAAASSGARRSTRGRHSWQRRRVRRKAVRAERTGVPNAPRKDSPTPGAQPIDRLPLEEDDYVVGSPRPPRKFVRRAPARPEPIPDIRNP